MITAFFTANLLNFIASDFYEEGEALIAVASDKNPKKKYSTKTKY